MKGHGVHLPGTLSSILAATCAEATSFTAIMTGHTHPVDPSTAFPLLLDCLQHCSREFTSAGREHEAYLDAADFIPHPDCISRNLAQLHRLGSIEDVIEEEQARTRPVRFHRDRWDTFAPPSPSAGPLRTLAVAGARICVPPTLPPPLPP